MDMSGLGYFASLFTATFVTAAAGCFFLIIAWASFFAERRAGQGSVSLPLWSFTCAVLLAGLGFNLEPKDLALSSLSLVFCWVLLVGTLILGRHSTGTVIGTTLKLGSIVLLGIGGLGLVTLTIR